MRELDQIETMHYHTGECLAIEINYKEVGKDKVVEWLKKNVPYYQLYVNDSQMLDRNEKLQFKLQQSNVTDIKQLILKRHETHDLMYGFDMSTVSKICLFMSHIIIDGRQAAYIFKDGFLNTQLKLQVPPIQMFQTINKYFNDESYEKFKQFIKNKINMQKTTKNDAFYQQSRKKIKQGQNNNYAEIYIKDIDQWIHKFNQKLSTLTILLRLFCIKEQHMKLFNILLEQKQFYLYQPIAIDYRDPSIDINTTGTFSTPGFIFFKMNLDNTVTQFVAQLASEFEELKKNKYNCLMAYNHGGLNLPDNMIYGFEQSNVGKINLDPRVKIYNYLREQIGDSFVFSFIHDNVITIRLYFNNEKYDANIIEDKMTQISYFITNQDLHESKLIDILEKL